MVRNSHKIYYLIIGFSFSIAFILFYFSYDYTQKSIKEAFFEQIKIELKHFQGKLKTFHDEKETLLLMLTSHEDVKNFLLKQDKQTEKNISKLFVNQVKSMDHIFQLRVLGLDGSELFRVDKNANKISIVKKSKLQNKFLRDYFQKFLTLEKNQIGFSNLDLNEEYGEVEKPFKPTMRLAMPVYIDGKKEAIVIINYLMHNFLEQLRESSHLDLYLINEDGYYILNANKNLDWSKYGENKVNAKEFFDINLAKLLAANGMYKEKNYIAKAIKFWDLHPKILIYKEKSDLGVNNLLEKSKFAGFLILIGIVLLITPIVIIILTTIRILREHNEQIEANEKKLNVILNNTFDSIVMIDKEGIIKIANNLTSKTFGYTQEELLGKNIHILIPPSYHKKYDDFLKNYDKRSSVSKIIGVKKELFGVHKDGTQIAINLALTQTRLEEELFSIATIRDITEQKRMLKKEKMQEHMIMQQSKLISMGEMVTAIAHQWRQPLNAIGLSIQDMVSAQKYGELDKEYVLEIKDEINEQLKFMSDTIDEFRNFFKQSNQSTLFNVIDLLNDILKLLWAQSALHELVLILHVKIDDVVIDANKLSNKQKSMFNIVNKPSELKQVLINLITNAKDAIIANQESQDVKNEIIIELEKVDSEIVILIKDYAGGIDEAVIDRVFEPYFTTKEMGTGLGLYICQMLSNKFLKTNIIVNQNELKEGDKVYKGTTFSLRLHSVEK